MVTRTRIEYLGLLGLVDERIYFTYITLRAYPVLYSEIKMSNFSFRFIARKVLLLYSN